MKNGREHIVVAIPTMNHKLTDGIMDFMLGLWELNANPKCPWYFEMIRVNGKTFIEAARNILVEMFLAMPTADRLFFIDSDTYPTPETLEMLRVKDAPIIAGLYPIAKSGALGAEPPITTSIYRENEKRRADGAITFRSITFDELNGEPMDVDALATGNMMIKREVFENPAMIAGKDPDGTRAFFLWPRTVSGQTRYSDDIDFCMRAKVAGYRIVAHTGVIWGHDKYMDLKWVLEHLVQAYWAGQESAKVPVEESTVVPA